MSQWDERVRAHRVWESLKVVGPSIDKALETASLTTETIDSLERFRAILAACGKRLASSDPILIHPSAVENIAQLLDALKNSLDAFASSGDTSQLNIANTQADNLLLQIVTIPNITTTDDLAALSEATSSYRAALEKQLNQVSEAHRILNERAQAIDQRIAVIDAALASEQQHLSTLIADYQSQFSTAQDKRATDFTAAQNDQLSKFTTAFTEFQTLFSGDQNTRNATFAEFERNASSKLADIISDANAQLSNHDKQFAETLTATSRNHSDRLEELQQDYANKASQILITIERHKKDVESLVGVIGNLGVTSGYQKTANSAKRMLYFWQFVTSLALAGLISVAFLTAFPALNEKLFGPDLSYRTAAAIQEQKLTASDGSGKITEPIKTDSKASAPNVADHPSDMAFYHGLATRIFLALTFGIFAGYSGKQASHFMEIEKKNRKLALELEALGPFIEPLSTEERNKFRIQIGERSFGVPDNDGEKHRENDPVTAWGLLKSKDFREIFLEWIREKTKT